MLVVTVIYSQDAALWSVNLVDLRQLNQISASPHRQSPSARQYLPFLFLLKYFQFLSALRLLWDLSGISLHLEVPQMNRWSPSWPVIIDSLTSTTKSRNGSNGSFVVNWSINNAVRQMPSSSVSKQQSTQTKLLRHENRLRLLPTYLQRCNILVWFLCLMAY